MAAIRPIRPSTARILLILLLLIAIVFFARNREESQPPSYKQKTSYKGRKGQDAPPPEPRKSRSKPWLPDEVPPRPVPPKNVGARQEPKVLQNTDPKGFYPIPPVLPNQRLFFAMWFSPGNTAMPEKMRLCLGSFFYHHPNETFRMYSNDLTPATFDYFTSRGYKIDVVPFDLRSVFHRCAPNPTFVPWVMEGNYLKPGALNRNVHITDALRLCFSYIHGGLYVDTDIFFLTRVDFTDSIAYINGEGGNCPEKPYELECSPPQTPEIDFRGLHIYLPREIYFSTGFYALSARSEFARRGLEHMQIYEDPNCWNCIGPRTFAHVYARMGEEGIPRPPLMPSCDDVREPFYTATNNVLNAWNEVKYCPYAHLYSSATALEIARGSLFWQLVRDMCIGCEIYL
ncbi:hypothetical protein BC937DRAFT_87554 [Endogone sp. FLAS-F59071]|nr:hypothetical protein BC937DRAFT_87554 [Endogone sp. FLAS-F59071]|eukprot:RUS19401.1 hypothetical protein BC937DRAFT_87554 [Endogone sp. FLAS-F59071]